MSDYDVVVIGAGPGGYVAAIRCAQLGMKVACIEGWKNPQGNEVLGGTCLNVGCIPSKALLDSSHYYHNLTHHYLQHGIIANKISLDIGTMMARKEKVVATLTGGIAALFTKNKIEWVKGFASFEDNSRIKISRSSNDPNGQYISAKHIIIATGSVPASPENIHIDHEAIVDSTDALSFKSVPKRVGVLGGGVVGLELSSVWSRLGSEVTVFVRGDRLLKTVDQQIADKAMTELQSQGIKFKLGASLIRVATSDNAVTLTYGDLKGENTESFDKLLVATGRSPNSSNLHLDSTGVKVDERGFIQVNEYWQTEVPNIYAIGDVIGGPMLAHKASEEGIAVAERLAGQHGEVNYRTIPWVIYTWPEIAWVGSTSEQLDAAGIKYKQGSFPFIGNGRAQAMGDAKGAVKVISDAETDEILGIHIFGPNASEMIGEAVVAMEYKASAEDIARTIHAHPTLSEALHEAALAVDKRAIHI